MTVFETTKMLKNQVLMVSTLLALASFAPTAFAQSADDEVLNENAWATETLTKSPREYVPALSYTRPISNPESQIVEGMSPQMRDSLFDISDDTSSPIFQLDQNGGLCLGTSSECDDNIGVSQQSIDLDIAENFSRQAIGKFDLSLTPRANVQFDDDRKSATVGALVKFGDNLISDDPINENTWYFFAGADAQAVTYVPGSPRSLYGTERGSFALQDRIIVGDAQAGVSYRLGDADVSLTYLRREGRAEDYKYKEDAAALSLTWRH